jgi:phage gp29-like protein
MSENKLLSKEIASRENYSSYFKNMTMLPNPDSILRKTGKTIEVYRELKNDPHVWSCIQSRKAGLLGFEYVINPNGCPTGIVKEIESIFASMDIHQIERDVLEAPLFGWQPFEIMWNVQGGSRKFIYPENIIAKPQEWFFFDGKGNLRFRQSGNSNGIEVPPMKIVYLQNEASYMNPYGHSLLSKCYWPVVFKNGGLKFWVKFAEKYGMPLLMGQYTRGASFDETQKLANELANMTEDAVIVAPSDIKIELQEAARTSSSNLYHDLIQYCNAEISKAILSQTLTTEINMGSYAASQTHFKIRREVILTDVKLVESFMNRIIKMIIDLNFAGAPLPKFKIPFNDSENEQIVDRDIKILQSGAIKFTKKYWMDNYGFKEDEIIQ